MTRRTDRRSTRPRSIEANVAALRRLLDADLFEGFPEPALYVYRLRSAEHEQTGIVGEVPPQAFVDGRILGHEGVQPERVDALGLHLARLGARSTLVALMFRADDDVRKIVRADDRGRSAPAVPLRRSRADGLADRRPERGRDDPGAPRSPPSVHHGRPSSGDGLRRALGASRPTERRRRARGPVPRRGAPDAGLPPPGRGTRFLWASTSSSSDSANV